MTIRTSLSRYLASAMALLSCLGASFKAQALSSFSDETLNYEVVYHWGMIWKHAASAKLSLQNSGDYYNTSLTAYTRSWADKIYPVRDTLTCQILKDGLKPMKYVKTSHEGKHYGKDIVEYSYSDGYSLANCTVIRQDRDTRYVKLQAPGQAYDMLSVFYFLRTLDFNTFKANGVIKSTVFSGKRKENVTVKYHKVEHVEMRNGSKQIAHHISFTFTQDGQTKSSDDIHCWISTDSRHIPLVIKGSLPVGEVRVFYVQ